MTTHTPGPWKVAQTGGFELAVYGRSKNQPICIFTTPDGNDIPQELKNGKANARLISAAPDLLDLAHNVGGLDDHVVTYGDIRTLRDLIIEWRDAARAAIAKAEGVS